ncbi:MAG: peptide-methionine (R)-S-oxide reductase MsrB [Planctomycetota bacterium]|nr:peptide-methionine (R)-S-oxide reductase MsrB [Planctomycetota bacterium]
MNETKSEMSGSGFPLSAPTATQMRELVEKLTPEQHHVTQKSGTEAPFCGGHLAQKNAGVYCCVVCQLPLYRSIHKFDSGTGWPSFFDTFDPQHVTRKSDDSGGMVRTEITCGRCDAHLGHQFPDGPAPTGLRHCLNALALHFHDEGQPISRGIAESAEAPAGPDAELATAWFGGG